MIGAAAGAKVIVNSWRQEPAQPFEISSILNHATHPEGLDVDRLRFRTPGSVSMNPEVGHIFSVVSGRCTLCASCREGRPLLLESGIHVYLPPGLTHLLEADAGTEIIRASSASATQARGSRMLLRDETFLAACASKSQSLRWILTPQYLSRRIFLHHDPVLLSKSGRPVSWFRTTMFDVTGLPSNASGEPVFKMSYNSRTEFNVCYEVEGTARVRMAQHPYSDVNQAWDPWLPLDADTTYHLNEVAEGTDEECQIDPLRNSCEYLRNKHEVFIANGHVSLICVFDPAPTGVERHRPGEYSDYEPVSQIVGSDQFARYQREVGAYDEMVDLLSVARADGTLESLRGSPTWAIYQRGRRLQRLSESKLVRRLAAQGGGRNRIIAPWMQSDDGP